MSTEPFEDILKRIDELTPEQQENLIEQLEKRQVRQNNGGESHVPRTLLDAFHERGLIGSIKGAPANWSTDPKYMEGFGQDDAE